MTKSCIPKCLSTFNKPERSYVGVGGKRINVLGVVDCTINYKNQLYKIKLNILYENEMYSMNIGPRFSKNLQNTLNKSETYILNKGIKTS